MAAEFPLPSASGSNPTPVYFEELEQEFVVDRTIYDDNGADYKLQHGGTGKRTFLVRYILNLLNNPTHFTILKSHRDSAFYSPDNGSASGFNLREHLALTPYTDTSGALLANVHYAPNGWKQSHTKSWIVRVEITLEKRP